MMRPFCAIMALSLRHSHSKLIAQCKNDQSEIGFISRVTLNWVPDHGDIPDNERADEIARLSSSKDVSMVIEV